MYDLGFSICRRKHLQAKEFIYGQNFPGKNIASVGGIILEQQPLIGSQENQQYDFISIGKNIYLIRAKGTDLYITPLDENGTTDSGITLAKKNGGKLQQWTIYEQKPTM